MNRVLVIDDAKRIRETYKNLLKGSNFVVDVADGSLDGLDHFINKVYDVVITDFNLEELNGLQMLEFFQTIDSKIPIIFYSNIADDNVIQKILNQGAFDFVPHSAGDRFLLHIIAKAIYERPNHKTDTEVFSAGCSRFVFS